MPAERFQEDRLALSGTDVGDLGEDDRMVSLGNLIHHMTFDPARAIGEHGRPDAVRSVFTFSKAPSSTSSATSCVPSRMNETANDFDRRTFAKVRLSLRNANATSVGLKEVCISHVPNISQSFPSSVCVPTMYAPYGICWRTFFFTFLSIAPPARRTTPRLIKSCASAGSAVHPFRSIGRHG